MVCFRPLKAYRPREGKKLAFDSKRGYYDQKLELPCGQCLGCRSARSEAWAIRCVHEAAMSECRCHPGVRGLHNSFITLTYSPQQLPADLSLDVSHWQKFAKRLRKARGPFRFFHVGEYGDQSLRPHYHALLFGLDFPFDSKIFKNTPGRELYISDSLTKIWGLGHATWGRVNMETANYVARYCTKKLRGDLGKAQNVRLNLATGEEWTVRPEYSTMSRRPGLGTRWFKEFKPDVFPSDEVRLDGRRHRPPRFYDSLLEREEAEAYTAVKAKRTRAVVDLRSRSTGDEYEAGLQAREAIAKSRLEIFTTRREI